MNSLDMSVEALNGIAKTRAMQLQKLGIFTLRDLIYHFPRAYENRGDVIPLSAADEFSAGSFILTVATEPRQNLIRRGFTITKFRAFDESGSIEVVFYNAPFVKSLFHIGSTFRFYGKITLQKKQRQLQNPKYEPYVEGIPLPDFTPIYPLTEGISSKVLDKFIKLALCECGSSIHDHLPESLRLSESLPTLSYALRNIHFPENKDALARALRRLAFDEIFLFGLGISLSNTYKTQATGIAFKPVSVQPLLNLFAYELTDSQKHAINDIYSDVIAINGKIVSPMARIIVGDVGCGKTVCAEFAIYFAASSGYQSALMVPTEILARQHYEEISVLFSKLGFTTRLLIGSLTKSQKSKIYRELEDGTVDIVVGTHALISEIVKYKNLGLVITDEQHRFGVNQRAELIKKGEMAHMLVMSATPIPRTLALTMYGDLDVSKITDMPKGRSRVNTFVVDEEYRTRLNAFIRSQIELGGQCYVVCPAIEASEDENEFVPNSLSLHDIPHSQGLNLKNAIEHTEMLRRALPDISIECLHGKMKAAEKDAIMTRFASGETKVLVSTTVIEVGVNVPNASLMIVENAERFGLSQLHQLRGRVGRGTRKSYCVLVSDNHSPVARERLNVMKTTYDGFEIAEKDLLLRGPGDFFSSNSANNLRQSGGFDFKLASMCDDSTLMERAFAAAKAIAEKDPMLELPEHSDIKTMCASILFNKTTTIS